MENGKYAIGILALLVIGIIGGLFIQRYLSKHESPIAQSHRAEPLTIS